MPSLRPVVAAALLASASIFVLAPASAEGETDINSKMCRFRSAGGYWGVNLGGANAGSQDPGCRGNLALIYGRMSSLMGRVEILGTYGEAPPVDPAIPKVPFSGYVTAVIRDDWNGEVNNWIAKTCFFAAGQLTVDFVHLGGESCKTEQRGNMNWITYWRADCIGRRALDNTVPWQSNGYLTSEGDAACRFWENIGS